jgi:uncharacterized protein YprB with RNaseH-like and TPR domain
MRSAYYNPDNQIFHWCNGTEEVSLPNHWKKAHSSFSPEVSCWTMAGERQSARIRSFYLKSVLRQDIAFFDTEMTTGEAVSRMSSDTVIIQDALGEKVILSLGY